MSAGRVLLQINVTANWGSTGKIAEQIGLLAMESGWDSYIAYGRMQNPSKSKLIKIGSKWDVYWHYFLSRFFNMEGLGSRRATKKLVKEIARIKPKVIHLHNIHDHYLNYLLLFDYLAEKKIPVVWTQHDLWAITGGCCYIPDGCDKWKVCCDKCVLRKGTVPIRSKKNYELKKRIFNSLRSLTIVPVSNWLGELIKESYLQNCQIKVIHNGIDTNLFKPQDANIHRRYGLEGKKIVLGVASEWSKRKGLGDILKMAEMLSKDEYGVIIVGRLLEKIHRDETEGCKVVFIERTQNAVELAAIYSAASVFVNPTYQDNYPTTNLEAMACGTPVITYRTGGSPEAVDEKTGVVIEQGNILEMKNAVLSLSHTRLSKECRKRAENLFNSSYAYKEYISLYAKLDG